MDKIIYNKNMKGKQLKQFIFWICMIIYIVMIGWCFKWNVDHGSLIYSNIEMFRRYPKENTLFTLGILIPYIGAKIFY